MLSDQQFERTRQVALRLAGIELVERHRELLTRRSQRLGLRDNADLDVLLDAAEAGEPAAEQRLLSLLTTKFTGFFRHPRHFDWAAEHALGAARRHGKARLWSAAAATGEEPYSLAMALLEAFAQDAPPAEILATDVEAGALEAARLGEYGESELKGLTPTRRDRFFIQTGVSGYSVVVPAVSRLVEFRALNLINVEWNVDGPFDVIFCRNVLMYLEACHRYSVLERMASLLAPDGLLMLDPAENLGKAGHLFKAGAEGVYARRPPARPAGAVTHLTGNQSR